MKRNDERLAGLLERLPRDFRHAIEFRHPSWYADPVYDMLRAHGLSVAPSTVMRWVLRCAPEFEKRWRPYEKQVALSWRVDETYMLPVSGHICTAPSILPARR